MLKNKVVFLIMIFFSILISTNAFTATLRYSANFDNQSIPPPPKGSIVIQGSDSEVLDLGGYTYGNGRGGSGYSLGSGTHHCPSTVWMYSDDWYTDELYVSFWVCYPSITPDSDSHWNVKVFYPHWDGANSYVHWSATGYGTIYYSARDRNQVMLTSGNWITIPNDMDSTWHRYEFWIKFSTGEHKFWYDGDLKRSDDFTDGCWTNALYYISFGSIDAEEQNVFTRFVDDIEVWDGLPNTPDTVKGLKILP